MGAQELRQIGFVVPVQALHALEKRRHGARIEAGLGEDGHADAVGLLLERAGVVEPLLRHGGGRERHRGFAALAAGTGQQYSGEHGRHGRKAHALRFRDQARDVPLGDVGGLMRQYRRQLRLALGGEHEAGVDADEPARNGEGVDGRVVYEKESECLVRGVRAVRQFLPQRLDIVVEFRIVHERQAVARLAHEILAELAFLRGRDDRGRFIAEIGEIGGSGVGGGGDGYLDRQDRDQRQFA